jgi:hypothetical protein
MTAPMVFSFLMECAWPLATVAVAYFAQYAAYRWIQQRSVDIAKHVEERDVEWRAKFETLERDTNSRITHLERNAAVSNSDFRPMGRNYNPRA